MKTPSPIFHLASSPRSADRPSSTSRGFTLVEIVVSLGVFSIVAVVALGALVRIIDANKKAQTLQSAMTNLNYALESMSRELRVGSSYYCQSGTSFTLEELTGDPAKCSPVDNDLGVVVAFNSSKKAPNPIPDAPPCSLIYAYRVRYDYNATPQQYKLEKAQQMSCGGPIVEDDFYPLTDPNVVITGYRVQVTDNHYPLASIKLSGYAGIREREKTYFDVQTAISPRLP